MNGGPAEVSRDIASMLEAERAPSYKPIAFRRAADAVERLPAAELERRWKLGRLQELPGIGATTNAIISEVLEGREPDYLVALRDRAEAGPCGAAGELLGALKGDCHTHSDWSDGGVPVEEMAREAIASGASTSPSRTTVPV